MVTLLRGQDCPLGKFRYASESKAIDGLIRIRKRRIETNDPHDHETRMYPCGKCDGWHLTSKPILHPEDFTPEHRQFGEEPIEKYAKRLEKRIAEQRAQLLSIHALGHGGNNRQARQRISALTVALSRMTERWEAERDHRIGLVARLRELEGAQKPRRRWLRRVA